MNQKDFHADSSMICISLFAGAVAAAFATFDVATSASKYIETKFYPLAFKQPMSMMNENERCNDGRIPSRF